MKLFNLWFSPSICPGVGLLGHRHNFNQLSFQSLSVQTLRGGVCVCVCVCVCILIYILPQLRSSHIQILIIFSSLVCLMIKITVENFKIIVKYKEVKLTN